PGHLQFAEVAGIDLVERRVTSASEISSVSPPLAVFGPQLSLDRHRRPEKQAGQWGQPRDQTTERLPHVSFFSCPSGSVVVKPENYNAILRTTGVRCKLNAILSARAHTFALATASGVLLTLSFPKFGHPAFAWIALAPLLVAISSRQAFLTGGLEPHESLSLIRAFALGLTTGIVYFTGTLYWITRTLAVYGDLQGWVAVLVNAVLIAYLALFPTIFAVVMRRLVFSYGARALAAAPLVWVTTELGRTYLFTGFPWVLLGYSQVTMLPIAQLASVFGVYGVSALVASVSAAAALVVAGRVGPAGQVGPAEAGHYVREAYVREVASVATAVLLVAVWGS